MNREEALALANEYVTGWTEQTKNQRGYVHDKWTPVEVRIRTDAVLQVADWLLGPPQRVVAPVQVEVCRWCGDDGVPNPHHHPGGTPEHTPI